MDKAVFHAQQICMMNSSEALRTIVMHYMTTVSGMPCVVNTASTTPSEVVDLSPIIFAKGSRGVDISGLWCGASCLTHWMTLNQEFDVL